MNSLPTLLVYDDAVETSEVLAAVYQPRGFSVERCSRFASREKAGAVTNPVVVLQTDKEQSCGRGSPRVVIGPPSELPCSEPQYQVAACRISSLFDYRELVSTIDRLLCGSD